MIIWVAVYLCACLLAGFAMASLFWRQTSIGFADLLLKLSLGTGLGLGVSSLILFLWLECVNARAKGELFFASAAAALLVTVAALRLTHERKAATWRAPTERMRSRALPALFWVATATATIRFAMLSVMEPHGGWDAWSIWNRHARALFLGGDHWRDTFGVFMTGFKPDYPLLTSAAIANAWFAARNHTALAPIAIAFLFTAATVTLTISSLSVLRNQTQGLVAGLVLMCTPAFLAQGVSQYADVPLSFFFLAAVALMALHDVQPHGRCVALAGVMAGMAAWTKNEGLVFVLVLVAVRLLVVTYVRGLQSWVREFGRFAVGLVPVIAVIAYFKLRVVGASDELLLNQTVHTFGGRMLTSYRYVFIAKAFVNYGLSFGGWMVSLPALMLMYLLLVGINAETRHKMAAGTALLTLVLMTACYFMVYVATPADLAWHIRTSLDRLLMQLFPLALFTFFLLARTPQEAGESETAGNQLGTLPHLESAMRRTTAATSGRAGS